MGHAHGGQGLDRTLAPGVQHGASARCAGLSPPAPEVVRLTPIGAFTMSPALSEELAPPWGRVTPVH